MKKNKGSLVRKKIKASFDPKKFLAKVGDGKTISKYRKDQIVFSQYNGKIEVHNSLLNVVLHDQPEIKTRDAGTPA